MELPLHAVPNTALRAAVAARNQKEGEIVCRLHRQLMIFTHIAMHGRFDLISNPQLKTMTGLPGTKA